jgi:hypothetical protein
MTRLLTNRVQIAASILLLALVGLTLAGASWIGAVAAAGVAGLAMAWASGRGREPQLIPVKARRDDRHRR